VLLRSCIFMMLVASLFVRPVLNHAICRELYQPGPLTVGSDSHHLDAPRAANQ